MRGHRAKAETHNTQIHDGSRPWLVNTNIRQKMAFTILSGNHLLTFI